MVAAQGRRGVVVNAAIVQANAAVNVGVAGVGVAAVVVEPPPIPSFIAFKNPYYHH
jgi:hypothetical protein